MGSSRRTVTVLISSAGRRGALVAAFRDVATLVGVDVRVVVIDRSPLSAAGHLADAFHLVPSVTDDGFADALDSVIEREGVDVIVPTIDPELPFYATHKAALAAAGVTVVVSGPGTVAVSADKRSSSRWLREHGFAAPQQFADDRLDDIDADRWPLFFKPVAGSSSIGAQRVDDVASVHRAVATFGPGVVEELVVGDEFTMDCWVEGGVCRSVVPRRRIATRGGEIAKGMTVGHRVLETETARLVDALPDAQGPITVQAMGAGSDWSFIEINPRFGGGYPLSHHAGARFTALIIARAAGVEARDQWLRWESDVVMLRYDDAVFVRAADLDSVQD